MNIDKWMKEVKPMKKVTDPFGKTLDIGVRVAYNISGQVAIGIITKMTPYARYTTRGWWLEIERENNFVKWPERKRLSKVKHENVCVIG